LDVVGGVSPAANPASAGLIVNRHLPHEEFVFNMNRVDPQIFAGFKGHLELGAPFLVDAGVMYTRKKSTYDVVYTIIDTEHPVSQHSMTQTNHMLMLPVNIGVNMGLFDVTSGFRLMKSVSSKTNLDQLTGFRSEGNPVELGWQAGFGFDIMRSRIGIEYQGNFSRVGKGMFVNEQPLELMNVPGHLVLLLQHSF
jgi:hypothetical protein